jgi:hypothetical protein
MIETQKVIPDSIAVVLWLGLGRDMACEDMAWDGGSFDSALIPL